MLKRGRKKINCGEKNKENIDILMHKKVTTYTSAKYINTNNLAFFLFSELGISVEYSQAKKKQ